MFLIAWLLRPTMVAVLSKSVIWFESILLNNPICVAGSHLGLLSDDSFTAELLWDIVLRILFVSSLRVVSFDGLWPYGCFAVLLATWSPKDSLLKAS